MICGWGTMGSTANAVAGNTKQGAIQKRITADIFIGDLVSLIRLQKPNTF
jgi:hypothetical protein